MSLASKYLGTYKKVDVKRGYVGRWSDTMNDTPRKDLVAGTAITKWNNDISGGPDYAYSPSSTTPVVLQSDLSIRINNGLSSLNANLWIENQNMITTGPYTYFYIYKNISNTWQRIGYISTGSPTAGLVAATSSTSSKTINTGGGSVTSGILEQQWLIAVLGSTSNDRIDSFYYENIYKQNLTFSSGVFDFTGGNMTLTQEPVGAGNPHYVAEIILYDKALTQPIIVKNVKFLADKYNINNELNYFISRWHTEYTVGLPDIYPTTIYLPLTENGEYDFNVDWGDGTSDYINIWNQPEVVHTYSFKGTYTVILSGTIKGFNFTTTTNGYDPVEDYKNKYKILKIEQWGNIILGTDEGSYFKDCNHLLIDAPDGPDLKNTINLDYCFDTIGSYQEGDLESSEAWTLNLNGWDVSNVRTMRWMFNNLTDIRAIKFSEWDVSNVTNMERMFSNNDNINLAYELNTSNWDVSNVTNMERMFESSSGIRKIECLDWDVSNVTNMRAMFIDCFNIDTDTFYKWDVTNVTNMDAMFFSCDRLNPNLGSWNIINVTNVTNILFDVPISTTNYDALLNFNTGWSSKNVISNLRFDANLAKYTNSGDSLNGRLRLTNVFNWTINDGGPA